jgi:ribosomal-protein-alanine N-acetyltransferase
MRKDPHAPAWSDADLAAMVEVAPQSARERRGWGAVDPAGGLAGFAVVASLRLPQAAPECELEFLLIAPFWRRTGIGRKLLEHVLGWAGEQGVAEIRLEVRASNDAAQRLYESSGFERIGVRSRYYANPAENAVLMQRRIGSFGEAALYNGL